MSNNETRRPSELDKLTVPPTSSSRDAAPSPDPEDWDRSILLPTPDATPPRTPEGPKQRGDFPTPNRATRSLSEVLRIQARKSLGRDDVVIDEEEGKRVAEELGDWINSDFSPYESDNESPFCLSKADGAEHSGDGVSVTKAASEEVKEKDTVASTQ